MLKNSNITNVKKTNHVVKKENFKFIQKNPEENQDSMSLFLKSKFQEIAIEKEKSLMINKNLAEKLNNIENNNDNNYIESKQLKVKTEEANNYNINDNYKAKKNKEDDDILIENKNLKDDDENKDNNEINDEDAKNYLFDEDQIKEFTYILIKNFEAQKLNLNKLKLIFDEVDQESDEIVLNDLALKISDALNM